MSDTKHCNLCGTTKPLSAFYTAPDGTPRAGCKACRCADSRRRDPLYYQAHAEACKARNRRWIENNRPRFNKLVRAAMQRSRRRKRDRGQTFLSLASCEMRPCQ